MPTAEQDARWMDLAVNEGRKGRCSPNPRVGAVVVQNDQVVAVGYHERAGESHAEVIALRNAGDQARGATLYCSLEPCNHHGRTPPCTEAILAAGIRRVVVGARDPNPNLPGKGLERLKNEGVQVALLDHRGATELLAPWAKYITTGLPHVSLKLALSLDGRIATRTGASRWVTGEEARSKVHELRAERDAVAVGINTAIADDPRLTVRYVPGSHPVRVVFDTQLRLPMNSKLVTTAREVPTWVISGMDAPQEAEEALQARGVVVLRVPRSSEGRVDMRAALQVLAEQQIVSLLIEGGAELAGSLLALRAVDDLHAFLAPLLLGPRGRPGAVDWAGPDTPSNAPRIVRPRWELCGDDAYVRGPLDYPAR
ncbi:MAG: bifunctional diaminohydroxyphosphoribosylaminopyrimidine deaminase/5-amino-6-(5-phosphoribosylamino)uracil reductase RibD [Polyangiaceae bacterium]|jgi:diaminohydroxyphosphoribosylaminopyrimidine deaminase/5-amino-6-(5-phosphoribosylamino)uracil reductase|nr:bifunctional diaminohydroxyphosphoribosylaminopyrimidine deaminase/5-amino-6-(5-phosphoribosylamino)uracil reductase RibD [Polyangiaceae bacterium]